MTPHLTWVIFDTPNRKCLLFCQISYSKQGILSYFLSYFMYPRNKDPRQGSLFSYPGHSRKRCHFRGMKSRNFKMFFLWISFLIKKEICLKIMKIMFGSILTIISSTIFKIYIKAVLIQWRNYRHIISVTVVTYGRCDGYYVTVYYEINKWGGISKLTVSVIYTAVDQFIYRQLS